MKELPLPSLQRFRPSLSIGSEALRAAVAVLAVAAMLLAPQDAFAKRRQRSIAKLEILSSAPEHVTDGDALVRIRVTGRWNTATSVLLLNGEDVTHFLGPASEGGTRRGVVEGFVPGENLLQLAVPRDPRDRLRKRDGDGPVSLRAVRKLAVLNHPASGPVFSGPQQQPFVCTTARSGLGQPIVDNQDSFGIPVALEDATGNYPKDGRGYPTSAAQIVGWSKNCVGKRRLDYQYRTTSGSFRTLDNPGGPLPADIAMTTTQDGETVPYIVRWERGTMNRFIYSVAMLAPATEVDPSAPDDSLWNGRLVFSLQGGVAIGRTQGSVSTSARLIDDVLKLGYAVVNSTGLRMNTHYNLELGGETALMLKEHFVEDHGVPLYTVGVGGSGGAIQQYIYAQNHPGLLDAAIPQYSFSDMITQTIHVGDCELLEHYFDATDRSNPRWKDIDNRRTIQGLNALLTPNMSADESTQWNLLYALYNVFGYSAPDRDPNSTVPAISECRRAWFGLTPLTLNPTFTNVDDIDKLAQGTAGVDWTHTGDLVNIYGVDDTGFARVPWDNVGVQYGLKALVAGSITPAEFIDLNAQVGSWKEPSQMVMEGFPFEGSNIADLDPWSSRNIALSPDGGITPAPRRTGNLTAIRAAYERGMRFDGDIDIPVIDWRHYLEDELDMHHSHQSFATRRRMQLARGNANNQIIWFTDARPARIFDQTPEAFEVIDEWMANIRKHPRRGVARNRPDRAVDRCFTTDGTEIAAGDDVWNGILDDGPPGPCTQSFPTFESSRIGAGGPIEGGIFKCRLQTVRHAVSEGLYGPWEPTDADIDRLQQIFPEGVCNWPEGDAGRPRR
ncbi:MAG: hypothetical protein JRH01_12315 [Deltaproteobacteria bacterium]|nr:hypothetical protein [Deltaproteobacteria bacterium]